MATNKQALIPIVTKPAPMFALSAKENVVGKYLGGSEYAFGADEKVFNGNISTGSRFISTAKYDAVQGREYVSTYRQATTDFVPAPYLEGEPDFKVIVLSNAGFYCEFVAKKAEQAINTASRQATTLHRETAKQMREGIIPDKYIIAVYKVEETQETVCANDSVYYGLIDQANVIDDTIRESIEKMNNSTDEEEIATLKTQIESLGEQEKELRNTANGMHKTVRVKDWALYGSPMTV